MIVAAYAGTGKSTFAARTENTVDLPIMPYRWILPPTEKPPAELEGEKGALYRLSDPRFPENYLVEILRAERTQAFVLIPTNVEVICRLQEEYGRKVLLCYPDGSCQEEYRRRFAARGNSESFLHLFIDGWDSILSQLRDNRAGVHIPMGAGEYLLDYRLRFDAERRTDGTAPVPEETIRALEDEAEACRKASALYLCEEGRRLCYPIGDLDAPEERMFLHYIGQMTYERDIHSLIMPRDLVQRISGNRYPAGDREAVMAFLEERRKGEDQIL